MKLTHETWLATVKEAEALAANKPFAASFLKSCAHQGLSPEQTSQAIKSASAINPLLAEDLQDIAGFSLEKLAIALPALCDNPPPTWTEKLAHATRVASSEFVQGFLTKCAEAGYSREETWVAIEKAGQDPMVREEFEKCGFSWSGLGRGAFRLGGGLTGGGLGALAGLIPAVGTAGLASPVAIGGGFAGGMAGEHIGGEVGDWLFGSGEEEENNERPNTPGNMAGQPHTAPSSPMPHAAQVGHGTLPPPHEGATPGAMPEMHGGVGQAKMAEMMAPPMPQQGPAAAPAQGASAVSSPPQVTQPASAQQPPPMSAPAPIRTTSGMQSNLMQVPHGMPGAAAPQPPAPSVPMSDQPALGMAPSQPEGPGAGPEGMIQMAAYNPGARGQWGPQLEKEAFLGTLVGMLGKGLLRGGMSMANSARPILSGMGKRVAGVGSYLKSFGKSAPVMSMGDVMAGKGNHASSLGSMHRGLDAAEAARGAGPAWYSPNHQVGMLGTMMVAPPLIEGGINMLRGQDPQQQKIQAAQRMGMGLAQAASLGDEGAFGQITGTKGMNPAVSQALQHMWANPETRQHLANQESAANLVYQMHQHLGMNPHLDGAQLAQVMSNQMGKAGAAVGSPSPFMLQSQPPPPAVGLSSSGLSKQSSIFQPKPSWQGWVETLGKLLGRGTGEMGSSLGAGSEFHKRFGNKPSDMLQRLGAGMESRPGLTGGLGLGAAGVGAMGLGSALTPSKGGHKEAQFVERMAYRAAHGPFG
jgi:hypothetical protein